MIEGSFTDFSALYTVLKLENIVSGVFWTVGCCNHVYIAIFIQGKQIQMKFSEEFSNTVLCLWELRIALNYTCLWWVRSVVFFVGIRKYFSVCSSYIYNTICFNCFQQLNPSRYKAVRSPAYPQNVVDLLGFQTQRRLVIYQRFQWENNEKNVEVHQM